MNVKQALLLAFKSMRTSKMRSFLTMLGIIIGVGAVIGLVSIINGFSRTLTETFESMGSNLLTVSIMDRGSNRTVSTAEVMQFAEDNRDLVRCVSPAVTLSFSAKRDTEEISTSTITGVNEYYNDISNLTLTDGRFLGFLEAEHRGYVCVIGTYVANELFPGENPLDQTLKIGGRNFTVVGLLEETADSSERSGDDVIYVPYSTAISMTGGRVSSYRFSAFDKDVATQASSRIEEFLTKELGSSDSFFIMDQASMLTQIDSIMGTISGVMGGIAGISLLVGGIGIMNIMLVSVTERTREIGIRKSLGGKRRDIMSQFIIEAAATSATGGVLGILLGYLLCRVAGMLLELDTTPTLFAIVLAFGVSVGIGMVFGYFPASKASKLNPIDALRHE